jgi:hypothetical protein
MQLGDQGSPGPSIVCQRAELTPRLMGGRAGCCGVRPLHVWTCHPAPWSEVTPRHAVSCQVPPRGHTPQGTDHIKPRCPFPFFLPTSPSSSPSCTMRATHLCTWQPIDSRSQKCHCVEITGQGLTTQPRQPGGSGHLGGLLSAPILHPLGPVPCYWLPGRHASPNPTGLRL